jgi:hypothetical protein
MASSAIVDRVSAFFGDAAARIDEDFAVQLDFLLGSGRSAGAGARPGRSEAPRTRPAAGEIWFSSTSSVAIGHQAHAAALADLAHLTGRAGTPAPLTLWFNRLRKRIGQRLGADGARVLLAPTPAEAGALARLVARALLGGELVEITAGANESEAAGAGARPARIDIPLRERDGTPRAQQDIDAEALFAADSALGAGRSLLLHALDVSKTGLSGVSRATVDAIRRSAPGRVLTMVDASQMRLSPAAIAADLAQGRMALVAGSHFVGGPAHCAALLLPAEIADQLARAEPQVARETSPARFDIPAELRTVFAPTFGGALANVGLGLRWSAALAELDRYCELPGELRGEILDCFARKARARAARRSFVDVEPSPMDEDDALRCGVLALTPLDERGVAGSLSHARTLRSALAAPFPGLPGDAICHLGAPVDLGAKAALPLSASAPMVSDVAERIARGVSFERAIAPVLRDLDTLFQKWEALSA